MKRTRPDRFIYKLVCFLLLISLLPTGFHFKDATIAHAQESTPEAPISELQCFSLDLVVASGEGLLTAQTPPNCDGGYLAGTLVELLAEPAQGYVLGGWSGTEDDSSLDLANSVTIIENETVFVDFIPEVGAQIVGGTQADPGEYPWHVALVGGASTDFYWGPGYQFCSGSLITPRWVLTAGHCVTETNGSVSPASSIDVVAGIWDLEYPAPGYQRRDVIQIIRHASYNDYWLYNDIALLKLASPITIGGSGETRTAIIPLVPSTIGSLTGEIAWVSGWGDTETTDYYGTGYPPILREVDLPILANSVCNDINHWYGEITNNMLCAGYDAGGKNACAGDSGGPLVVQNAGQWQLAGIVSWGSQVCSAPYLPGVYTRVSQYVSWVNSYLTPQLTVNRAGSGVGTVTSNPTGIDCGTDCSESYAADTQVTLTATASNNSIFAGWSGDCSGTDTSCVVSMTQNRSVVAAFNAIQTGSSYAPVALQDGYLFEISEDNNTGWRFNANGARLYVGDDNHNRQFLSILSFDTSPLPNNAVILSATLNVKRARMLGTNPFNTHGALGVEIGSPCFGSSCNLEASDFQAGAQAVAGLLSSFSVDGWHSAPLGANVFSYIDLTGATQFRLRFELEDNNDGGMDAIQFLSGDAPPDDRPQLIIEYYVP